jgi:medium-chain acyl-[acyl-carrier-protein] hydrolase
MSSWFLNPKPSPSAKLRLFCFPFAGVGASVYRGWADAFGSDVDLRIVQLPGREARLRDQPIGSVDAIVAALCDAAKPLLDRPYAAFGHSLGGLIAFELLRALRDADAPAPERLFVSATRAPQLRNPHPPLRHLADLALLRHVDERYCGSVPQAVMESAELREFLVPPLRADLTALETYTYRSAPPIACGLSVFGGTDDATVPSAALEAWREQTSGSFRLRMIQGGHLYLQPSRAMLVDAIRNDLFLGLDRSRAGIPATPVALGRV